MWLSQSTHKYWNICTQNLSPNKVKMVKTFCTKPFPLFNTIGDLIDGTHATSNGISQARQTSVFDCHNSPACNNSPGLVDSRIDPVLIEASHNMDKALNEVCPFKFKETSLTVSPQSKKASASFYSLDNNSSSNEVDNMSNNTSSPSPSPPPIKHKHTKSTRPSTSNASKSCYVSAGQGMTEMATSLADMVKIIKKKRALKTRALTPPLRLPQDPLERAIITLETDAEFSDNKMMDIINIFMANQDIAKVYATLQTS